MTAPKRPAHRPPLPPGVAVNVPVNLRMTAAQREKLRQLGGAAWVRRQVDAAPMPRPE